jgi:Ca2+-binding RTX toxin-like protein
VLVGGDGQDALDGGTGVNWAYYGDRLLPIEVALTGSVAATVFVNGVAEDSVRNVQNVLGSVGNDVIGGDGADNWLVGDGGSDTLRGGAGADRLEGGLGNDVLGGDAGDDRVDGGDGVDTASYAGAAAGVTVDLRDTDGQDTGGAGVDKLISIENIIGSDHGDMLTGNAGINMIWGGGGHDKIQGLDGDDWLYGGDGDDIIEGGNGIDTIYGEGGNDTLYSGPSTSVSAGTDRSTIYGGEGDDEIFGGKDKNLLHGDAGNDIIHGGIESDELYGGDGNDTLYSGGAGGRGHDLLFGGRGDDTLISDGNAFRTYFMFDLLDGTGGVDTIVNFQANYSSDEERWQSSRIYLRGDLGGRELTADEFHIGTSAADAEDRVIYDDATGKLWFDADGSGAGEAVLFATVDPGLPLSEVYFII